MGVIAKQSIRGTIVTYLGIAVGIVTTFFVLTRFLTAEEIGLARVLIDAATLFIGLAQLGTNASIIRFYPYFKEKDSDDDHGFFFWALIVPFVGFLFFALIYWACQAPLSAWFGDKSPLFVEYYYFVLPLAFFMLYQAISESTCNVLMHIVLPRGVRELMVRVGLLVLYLLVGWPGHRYLRQLCDCSADRYYLFLLAQAHPSPTGLDLLTSKQTTHPALPAIHRIPYCIGSYYRLSPHSLFLLYYGQDGTR